MIAGDHLLTQHTTGADSDVKYHASCSCGWLSLKSRDWTLARAAANAHFELYAASKAVQS